MRYIFTIKSSIYDASSLKPLTAFFKPMWNFITLKGKEGLWSLPFDMKSNLDQGSSALLTLMFSVYESLKRLVRNF